VRAAIYARVSTLDQQPENQLAEFRRYVAARGWEAAVEYVDHGVSDFSSLLTKLSPRGSGVSKRSHLINDRQPTPKPFS
jgi:DNA invertase Pin-like site-specific DNA recombinase